MKRQMDMAKKAGKNVDITSLTVPIPILGKATSPRFPSLFPLEGIDRIDLDRVDH